MATPLHYTTAVWGGRTQWKCNYCAFDTVESEQVMIDHILRHFTNDIPKGAAEIAKPSILVADRFGQEKK